MEFGRETRLPQDRPIDSPCSTSPPAGSTSGAENGVSSFLLGQKMVSVHFC
jgi:hypothetical protein